jgi:hypothetical protein
VLKAIHLYEELVKRLLTFVMPTTEARATLATYGVNLIYEDDTRRVLLGLLKEVTYTARAYTDKHLNEI